MLFKTQIDNFIHHLSFYHREQIKNLMRSELVQMRRIMRKEEVEEQSNALVSRLEALPEWQSANCVLCYYPVQNEVDIRPLLEKYKDSKTMLLPATAGRFSMSMRRYTGRKDLHKGRYGIPTPSKANAYSGRVDLILVPGVAFDKECRRLGRGGGYYDRFLHRQRHGQTIALAYDFQIVPKVPVKFHDERVDKVLTPTQLFNNPKTQHS